MTVAEAHAEVKYGWANSYSPEAVAKAVDSLSHKPLGYRINIFIARICFRGIYFPQMGPSAWMKVISQNRRTIFKLAKDGYNAWRRPKGQDAPGGNLLQTADRIQQPPA